MDCSVTLVDTGISTMTGGRLKRLREHLKDEKFFLTYGDGVSNIDIKNLALGSGYKNYYRLDNLNKIDITLKKFFLNKGPSILEIITKFGFMKNLVRPKNLHSIKKNFMNVSD